MKCLSLFTRLAAVVITLAAAGCLSRPKPQPVVKPAPSAGPRPSYWKGETASGAPKIIISLGEQRAYFYKGETVVGEAPISSGRRGFETPAGSYRVIQRDKDHVSNLYGDFVDELTGEVVKRNVDVSKEQAPEDTVFVGSKMPYFLRFHKGYGLHAGRLPGRRASHGCVRLPRFMAAHFYQNAPSGTPVIVAN